MFRFFADFPEAPKLILFMVTTWPTFLSHDGALCRAVNTVSRLKAGGDILDYLSKYLHWDEVKGYLTDFQSFSLFLWLITDRPEHVHVSAILHEQKRVY